MVIVHLCLFNYCLLLSVSQVSLFSFDGSALTLCSLLFLKDALSVMCFIPPQPSLSTLFSLSLLAKQEVGCQDCNLKDLRTITLNTRHHVTQRQERKERHKTSDSRLKYCSVAFSILLHILCREITCFCKWCANERHTNTSIFRLTCKFSYSKIEKATAPKKRKTEKG